MKLSSSLCVLQLHLYASFMATKSFLKNTRNLFLDSKILITEIKEPLSFFLNPGNSNQK